MRVTTDGSAPATVPAHGRAGRDLRAATGVGLALAGLVLGSLLLWRPAFVALALAVTAVAVWELRDAFALKNIRLPLVPVILGGVLMIVGAYAGGHQTMVVALALTVVAVLVWRLAEDPPGYTGDVAAGIFVAVYVPFLAGFAMLLLRPDDGAWRVLTCILVVFASDTGGYVAGVVAGRHPLAPTVSPKKSWEGLVGAVVACVAVASLAVVVLLGGSWWVGVLLGAAAAVTATLGDLAESMIKRDLGIKDMSRLLPGHGGIMDRLDSLLPTAPVSWLVLSTLVPAG
ncbi:MAG: phosphatidate cytidylyltransferase [Jiangellaceae bacterium]|nr:phosphatidate cytidylyltransferase [Jiangellaceae bacterium]